MDETDIKPTSRQRHTNEYRSIMLAGAARKSAQALQETGVAGVVETDPVQGTVIVKLDKKPDGNPIMRDDT